MADKTNQTTDELSVNASSAKPAKSAAKGKTGAKSTAAKSGAKAGAKNGAAKSKAAANKATASESTAGSKAQTGTGARRGRPPKTVAASADDDKITANVNLGEAENVGEAEVNNDARVNENVSLSGAENVGEADVKEAKNAGETSANNDAYVDANAANGIAILPLTDESRPVAVGEIDAKIATGKAAAANYAPNAPAEGKRKKSAAEITMFWVSIGLCVLMLPLLLMNVVLIFKSIVHPNDLPTIFGYKPLIVLSDSMYPNIKKGDLIFTQVVDVKDLKPGDVITYREYEDDGKTLGTVVTHKIYDITIETDGEHAGQLKFRTYGINNQRQADGTIKYNENGEMVVINMDDAVYAPQIEGRYTSKITGLGSFIYWMQGTWGLIVCIGIPLVAFIVYEFIKRNEEMKAQRASNASATNELEELRKKLADLEKKD